MTNLRLSGGEGAESSSDPGPIELFSKRPRLGLHYTLGKEVQSRSIIVSITDANTLLCTSCSACANDGRINNRTGCHVTIMLLSLSLPLSPSLSIPSNPSIVPLLLYQACRQPFTESHSREIRSPTAVKLQVEGYIHTSAILQRHPSELSAGFLSAWMLTNK